MNGGKVRRSLQSVSLQSLGCIRLTVRQCEVESIVATLVNRGHSHSCFGQPFNHFNTPKHRGTHERCAT